MSSESEAVLQTFTSAVNSFTVSAYKEVLRNSQDNFLVSPLSAETVLAFAHSGCKDETAEEIRKALSLPDDNNKIELAVKNFLHLPKGGEDYALHAANKLYIKEKLNIKEEFKKVALDVYQSDVGSIDFERQEEAAEAINKWVEEKTNNKIKNLISPNDFDELTRVVIVSALYFKADWVFSFPGQNTDKQDFYVTREEVIKVDMMHYYARYNRYFGYHTSEELGAQFLELPFKGREAFIVIVLPTDKEGLPSLENQSDKVFASCSFGRRRVNISLPKFKIDSEIDFKKLLQNLGVRRAFDEEKADLSGIAGVKGDLLIDKVIQKTFIDVNEEGVEAAAATFVSVRVPMSGSNMPPVDFIADHPFIFYIKIKDAIAFAGRVTRPLY